MKNVYHFAHAILIIGMLLFVLPFTTFGQCTFTVTDGQPFFEGFEDAETTDCWTIDDSWGGTWAIVQGTNTTLASFTHKNDGDMARLISPVLDMSSVSEATCGFTYAMIGYGNSDELIVSYRTSEDDSWHELSSYSLSDFTNFYEDVIALPELSSTYQISFLCIGHAGIYVFIDNIEIASSSNCSRPINLYATDITSTTAVLHWSSSDNAESWVIDLNGEEHNVDAQPYLIDNLTPQTTYTFKVKAVCGEGEESDWALAASFTTLCDVITVTNDTPYFDDFESSDDFTCWISEIISGEDNWVVDPGYVIPNHTAFFIWLGGEARLVSTPMDISTVTKPTLVFKRRQRLNTYNIFDDLSVWFRATTDADWQQLANFPFAAGDWEEVVLTLPNPSETYQISFLATSHNAEGVYVDDVMVGDADAIGVGVAEAYSLQAYVNPNPTKGKVTISTNNAEGEVTVFDLSGRKLTTAKLVEGRVELDLSGFAQGVYTARVTSDNDIKTIKLIKE